MKVKVGMYVVFGTKEQKLYRVEEIHLDSSVGMTNIETGGRMGTWINQLRPYYLQVDTMISAGSQGNYRIKNIYFEPNYGMGYTAEVYRKLPNVAEHIKRTLLGLEEDFKGYTDKL